MTNNSIKADHDRIESGVLKAARHHGILKDEHASLNNGPFHAAEQRDPLAVLAGETTAKHLKAGTATLPEVAKCEANASCTAGMVLEIASPEKLKSMDSYFKNINPPNKTKGPGFKP